MQELISFFRALLELHRHLTAGRASCCKLIFVALRWFFLVAPLPFKFLSFGR